MVFQDLAQPLVDEAQDSSVLLVFASVSHEYTVDLCTFAYLLELGSPPAL